MTTTKDDRTHGGVYPDVERVEEVIRQMPEVGFGAHYVDAVRAARDALAALSSLPADEVREALINAMIMVEVSNGMVEFADDESDRADAGCLADAILSDPRFEVRLRGTVTEGATDV